MVRLSKDMVPGIAASPLPRLGGDAGPSSGGRLGGPAHVAQTYLSHSRAEDRKETGGSIKGSCRPSFTQAPLPEVFLFELDSYDRRTSSHSLSSRTTSEYYAEENELSDDEENPDSASKVSRPHSGPDYSSSLAGRFFDSQGKVAPGTPRHWTLLATCHEVLHRHRPPTTSGRIGLSQRIQMANARATLEADHLRTTHNIMEVHRATPPVSVYPQLQRHRELMFEPLPPSAMHMAEVFFEDISDYERCCSPTRNHSLGQKHDSHKELKVPSSARSVRKHWKSATSRILSSALVSRSRRESDDESPSKQQQLEKSSGNITGSQRLLLQGLFSRYTMRVSCPSRPEPMQRCTWFRFLYHCGLLGCQGGVPFALASDTFANYADATQEPPIMQFGNWFSAILRVLREAISTQGHLVSHLFDEYLLLCEARLGGPVASPSSPRSPPRYGRTQTSFADCVDQGDLSTSGFARQTSGSSTRFARQTSGQSQYGFSLSAAVPRTISATDSPPASVGVLGWQTDLAEEQLCEPEVITLLHQYMRPLRALFLHFAKMKITHTEEELRAKQLERSRSKMSPSHQEVTDSDSDASIDLESIADSESFVVLPGSDEEAVERPKRSEPVRNRSRSTPDVHNAQRHQHLLALPARRQGSKTSSASASTSEEETTGSLPLGRITSRSSSKTKEAPKGEAEKREHGGDRDSFCAMIRMKQDNFRHMAKELGLYPDIVQKHSLRQHIQLSLARRKGKRLTFAAFVECLFRIGLVYLGSYGNIVQQQASSMLKCYWLLALLRYRCQDRKVQLLTNRVRTRRASVGAACTVASDEKRKALDEATLWTSRLPFELEGTPLRSLLVYKALDSKSDKDVAAFGPRPSAPHAPAVLLAGGGACGRRGGTTFNP